MGDDALVRPDGDGTAKAVVPTIRATSVKSLTP